jgi:hypothetical protein
MAANYLNGLREKAAILTSFAAGFVTYMTSAKQ